MVNFIKKQNIYGPVEKLQFLSDAAAISELSRAELAVLNVLADMANATTGLAWPSFQTLGKRIGTTDRSAKRAVSGLAKAGLLEIVEHGTRNHKSNRYKLGKIQTSDTDVTTAASDTHVTTPSDTDDTTLVTRVTGASDTCDQKLVTRTSPKSIHSIRAISEDGMIDRDAAAPLRPGGLGAGRQTVESDCSEFWQALGRQQTVYQSEQLIAELVASGIDYADIVAGAKRYAEYCTRTGAAQKMTPASWLSNRKWLDDWQLPAAKSDKPSKPKNEIVHLKPSEWWDARIKLLEGVKKHNQEWHDCFDSPEYKKWLSVHPQPVFEDNPEYRDWSDKHECSREEQDEARYAVIKHIGGDWAKEWRLTPDSECGCPDCEVLWERYILKHGEEDWRIAENAPTENLCATGRELYEKLEAAIQVTNDLKKNQPPRYLGDIEDSESAH